MFDIYYIVTIFRRDCCEGKYNAYGVWLMDIRLGVYL